MGISNVFEERKRLLQSYEGLANGFVSEGGVPFGMRREYRELRDAYDRYTRAPHEVHVSPNEEVYLGAANRVFSKELEKFRRKFAGGKNE